MGCRRPPDSECRPFTGYALRSYSKESKGPPHIVYMYIHISWLFSWVKKPRQNPEILRTSPWPWQGPSPKRGKNHGKTLQWVVCDATSSGTRLTGTKRAAGTELLGTCIPVIHTWWQCSLPQNPHKCTTRFVKHELESSGTSGLPLDEEPRISSFTAGCVTDVVRQVSQLSECKCGRKVGEASVIF